MENEFFCEYIGDSSDLCNSSVFRPAWTNRSYDRLMHDYILSKTNIPPVGPIFKEAKQFVLTYPPFALYNGEDVTFKGRSETDTLSVIGLTMPFDVLSDCEFGLWRGTLRMKFESGNTLDYPLRSGLEISPLSPKDTDSLPICKAKFADRFSILYYLGSDECYVMNKLDIKLPEGEVLREVKITASAPAPLLIYSLMA